MMQVQANGAAGHGGLLSVVLAALAFVAVTAPTMAVAQPGASTQVAKLPNAETFVSLAHSSAVVQARAAELVASRETRPEARSFAQRMVEFRRGQIARLEGAARENSVPIPALPQFEHRMILENLEPLDFLALSRRYAEFQVQALEQELQIYASVQDAPAGWLGALSGEMRPDLSRLLDEAREMQKAVGP
jgi:predicted outer membrane protein